MTPGTDSCPRYVAENFNDVFPFHATVKDYGGAWPGFLLGRQRCRLAVGETLNLTGGNPVRVVAMSSTSFTLQSLSGHFEGANKRITFSFQKDDDGNTIFSVEASGGNSWWQQIPLGLRVNRAFAHETWHDFAYNLIAAGVHIN